MKYAINCSLYAGTEAVIEFPEGKTWEDVQDWFVKWDTLHVVWEDGTRWDKNLNSDSLDVVEWKHPASVEVHPADEDDNVDYNVEVASS